MKLEIEVKAKIKNLGVIISKLKKIGCIFSEPIIQDDYIYNVKGIDLSKIRSTLVLRIRVQGKRIIFTLKKNRNNELDCIEKEVDVNNKKKLEDIIELLGFKKTVEVHKKRIKTKYHDYEICLDEVKDLGSFVEVEKMSDEDGEKIQKELFNFLKTFGVKEEDRMLIGYDTMVLNKKYK
jgi:adenylate cyclase class 2